MQKLWLRARPETKRFPARPTCHSRAVTCNPFRHNKTLQQDNKLTIIWKSKTQEF